MTRILLLEDDPLIARSLQMSLSYEGFDVRTGTTLAQARELTQSTLFDFFILDVNLPDGTGFDFCSEIRAHNENVPIIMLTAKTDEESAVNGIGLGADDYVRKPCGSQELAMRIHRLLERKVKIKRILAFGSLQMDLNKRVVSGSINELSLGRKEFEILKLLMQKQGNVVTREEMIKALGEDSGVYDRTIDSHLSHLRKKFRTALISDVSINPVYGVGYRLEVQ